MEYEFTLCLLKNQNNQTVGFILGAGPEIYSEKFICRLARRMKKRGFHAIYVRPESITFISGKNDQVIFHLKQDDANELRRFITNTNVSISLSTAYLPYIKAILNDEVKNTGLKDIVCSRSSQSL